eukprot:8393490-Prorocentrum_lima.AAC.1
MVFVQKFLTPQQMKESNTTKALEAKSRMVICGKFATDTERHGVSRAAKTGESEHEVEENARIQIKHSLQYLAMRWNWCLTIRPHEH